MSGGVITNVRLVKCPKCNRVLLELIDVPVYRCGACGVVLQAKNRKAKIEETRSVEFEGPLVPTLKLGNARDSEDLGSICQNGNHVPCVTEVEGGNVSNEHNVDDEYLAADDGNSRRNEQQESASHLKEPSKDEVHLAGAREIFVATDPFEGTSYEQDHHTGDSPSYFSGSDCEKHHFSLKDTRTVECQSQEVVQCSRKNIFRENGASCESASVEADELLIRRKRRPIVDPGDTHLAKISLSVDRAYDDQEHVNEIASTFSSPISEELQSFGAKSSSPNEIDSAYGSSYSDVIQALPIKKTEQSKTSSPSVYDSVNRANELGGTSAVVPISSELNGTFGKISKSVTTRSGHGYDGSISSYEDQYDQIYRETVRDVNYPENVGKRNSNANQVSNITAMQKQAQEFFSEKNHRTSSWNSMESDELMMRRQIRNQMGFEAEIYLSGAPFTSKAYANDSYSSDCWDGIRSNSSIYSADKLPYTEKKRVELLKMVHELQEELSRLPTGNGNGDRRNISQFENIIQLSKVPQMPEHHIRRGFMDDADLRSNYSRYPHTRSKQGTSWPRHENNSWVPFSGEVRNRRHWDEYYCQHPLRVHDVTYNDQRLRERYVKASLANSSIASDHLRNNVMKTIHGRENQLRVMRQIRPTAGGAPFITCYQCWKMLQLPSDSFFFKRKFHKLKCGSCSTILRFSLEDRTHMIPYYRASPPGEVECRSPVINHTSNMSSRGIQMSGWDGEPKKEFLAAPSQAAQASGAGGKKTSSGGSSDILEGKKKRFFKQLFSKDKGHVRSPETSSRRRTFNIEDYSLESNAPKPRTGSPLHRLMGYTSISEVFRGPGKGTSK